MENVHVMTKSNVKLHTPRHREIIKHARRGEEEEEEREKVQS